jgi:crotonobetainyl-CoA:carnitine CoA-transferase CaiB-like acyl-CoA transferase
VLDFGHTVMGPTCGLVLADLGADVIRIEPIEGERSRGFRGFACGFFKYFNRNKRSVAVDLKHPDGIAVVKDLIRSADVLLENFAPGTMERLGLGWDAVRAVNERLIYCSLKGYLNGPYEQLLALDEVVQMQAGLAYMTGPPGMPLRAGSSVVDITGGLFGVVGVLAALHERERTGRGHLVQSALFESTAFLVGQHMAAAAISGEPSLPMPARKTGTTLGSSGGAWSVYDAFEMQDGSAFIAVATEAQWQRFCQLFGLEALAAMPEFVDLTGRLRNRVALAARLKDVFRGMTVDDVVGRCRDAQIACAPVGRPDDLFDDPHLNAGGGLLAIDIADGGQARLPALPLAYDGQRFGLRSQPPACGNATTDALAECGYSRERIAALAKDGIVAGIDEQ